MVYERVFKDKTKKIVEALLDSEKSLALLSEVLNLSKPTLQQKHLSHLERIGMVKKRIKKTETGREAYYSLRRFSLFFTIDPGSQGAISIVTQSKIELPLLLLEQVRDNEFKKDIIHALKEIKDSTRLKDDERPECVILFGSVARDQGTWKSDIDLAIINTEWSKALKDKYLDIIAEVAEDTEHLIKPQFLELSEFEDGSTSLIKEIKDTGMVVYGDLFGRAELWRQMKRYKNIKT